MHSCVFVVELYFRFQQAQVRERFGGGAKNSSDGVIRRSWNVGRRDTLWALELWLPGVERGVPENFYARLA
jgi:hypothetical protein